MNNGRTQEELEQERKNARIADKEIEHIQKKMLMQKIMEVIEDERKKRMKTCSRYTQAYVAEKSRISISTYKNYLSGNTAHLPVITLLYMADVLNIIPDDIFKSARKKK